MIKAVIIDDEIQARNALKEDIKLLALDINIVGEAGYVEDAVKIIDELMPDLVFMDIQLNDGTGFQVLDTTKHKTHYTIFTTAYNQYAIKAFKVNALDYLLKPVDIIELQNSLQKAASNIQNQSFQKHLEILLQQLSGNATANKQIVLKDIDKTYFINIKDIIYCLAEGAYTKFYIINSNPILISHNLRSYEELLEPAGFIRTHHSCLVNPNCIKIFDRKTEGGILVLEGGHTVPVSQRKKDIIVHLLEKRNQ